MPPSDKTLVQELEKSLSSNSRCALIKRCPLETNANYSNPTLEAVDVRIQDRQSEKHLELVYKQLKPSSKREVLVYRELSRYPALPVPKLYASGYDDDEHEYWVLIERLSQREISSKQLVNSLAKVLSAMHAAFWNDAENYLSDTARTHIEEPNDDLLPDRRFAIFVKTQRHSIESRLFEELYSEDTLTRLQDLVRALSHKVALIHHEANSDEIVYCRKNGRPIVVDLEMTCVAPVYLDFVWLYRMTKVFHAIEENFWAEFKENYGNAMTQRGCENPCDERFDFFCSAAELARGFWEIPALVHRIDSGLLDLREGLTRIEKRLGDLKKVTNALRA